MHRLGELSEQQRSRIGWSLLVVGSLTLAVGIVIVHWAQFGSDEVVPVLDWMPRGWFPKTVGYLVAFGGSQMMLVGAAFAFVLGRRMSWATAGVAAFLTWIEFVIIFAMVPSEWLNLAQTDLDWSSQRVLLTIPPWLVLGNEVEVSYAAAKDAISGTYNLVMLGAAILFAYKIQEVGKPRPAPPAEAPRLSPYGRPLVKGGE
ncbi:MAG: hypothetical protein R6X29_01655 [Acidimicrobiia bacterium]|jgi:hypothetical protein